MVSSLPPTATWAVRTVAIVALWPEAVAALAGEAGTTAAVMPPAAASVAIRVPATMSLGCCMITSELRSLSTTKTLSRVRLFSAEARALGRRRRRPGAAGRGQDGHGQHDPEDGGGRVQGRVGGAETGHGRPGAGR